MTGWKSSQIISRFYLACICSLFCNPNITDLVQGEHPEIFDKVGAACGKNVAEKSGFRCTITLISLKRGKVGPRLLRIGNHLCAVDCGAKINYLG